MITDTVSDPMRTDRQLRWTNTPHAVHHWVGCVNSMHICSYPTARRMQNRALGGYVAHQRLLGNTMLFKWVWPLVILFVIREFRCRLRSIYVSAFSRKHLGSACAGLGVAVLAALTVPRRGHDHGHRDHDHVYEAFDLVRLCVHPRGALYYCLVRYRYLSRRRSLTKIHRKTRLLHAVCDRYSRLAQS